ncbi:hypothetical protein PHYSODRAFT_488198 [Phytophthora sojae]|uniref:HTH CENPB-type domain-containing protein n=1 Tax=Phytophthora sojae (strain P6497) TaxID=1094619 RepID=G4ZA24_PHYSP|nr:hypothetical protein PHYSODRAFT_488198 [Phytophthora sojae]EGZ21163.1 hypothetical protein PHYSODRAFT_488198 [Phytophthora sojae]|eukprot:XP_009523880.1 hypothetical protein PHYSODRAFT_488198 [Phytophthora sojae]
MFRDLVRQAAPATSIKEVPEDFPNMKWVQRWMKKHSKVISYRKGRILDVKRAECSTTENVHYYYNNTWTSWTSLRRFETATRRGHRTGQLQRARDLF